MYGRHLSARVDRHCRTVDAVAAAVGGALGDAEHDRRTVASRGVSHAVEMAGLDLYRFA